MKKTVIACAIAIALSGCSSSPKESTPAASGPAKVAPPAILQAGTINNARQFRLDKDYGSVEAGKIGNLLLLTANPLESVRAWPIHQVDWKREIVRSEIAEY